MNKAAPPPPPSDRKDFSARFKYRFSIPELAEIFGRSVPTIKKFLGDAPAASSMGRKSRVYDLADVCELTDSRKKGKPEPAYLPNKDKHDVVKTDENGDPIGKISAAQSKLFYQAKDLEESYRAKKLRNDTTERQLIPAVEIEKIQAAAFKPVAMFADNFADILERNGIITRDDVPRVMEMTDKLRNQLADDMERLDLGRSEEADDETEA